MKTIKAELEKERELHMAYKRALIAEYADRVSQLNYWQNAFLGASGRHPEFLQICHEEGSAGE